MLEMASKSAEWLLLLSGVILILTCMVQYGRRTRNWGGVMTMFYKRVSMTAVEFKFYRSGVAAVILAIILRMVNLVFWP